MRVPVHNVSGQVVDEIELSASVFEIPANEVVVHQALVRQLANRRQGTADTKTRSEVAGGGAKFRRQKGTGRARVGSLSSPLRRGGGVAFGPHPRSYRKAMPRKMRRLAIRCVLSAKAANGELIVVGELRLEQPKTKEMIQILGALGVDSSALIVMAENDVNVVRSARNLRGIKTLPATVINVADLLSHRFLIMTRDAVHKVEELWGLKQPGAYSEKKVTIASAHS